MVQEIDAQGPASQHHRDPPESTGITDIAAAEETKSISHLVSRSHRSCRLGLKGLGWKQLVLNCCFFPVLKGQHRQAPETHISRKQSSPCPRTRELIPRIKTASCCSTFSRLPLTHKCYLSESLSQLEVLRKAPSTLPWILCYASAVF